MSLNITSTVSIRSYNMSKKSDGPGRFKATLVERDAYWAALTRYIHRNPVETKKSIVNNLASYP